MKQNNTGSITTSFIFKDGRSFSYVSIKFSKWIVFVLEKEKILVYVNNDMLQKLMDIVGVTSDMNDTDIITALICSHPLVYTYNSLTKQLMNVEKPE